MRPKLDPATFERVTNLMFNVDWLKRHPQPLIELSNFCAHEDEWGLVERLLKRLKFMNGSEVGDAGQKVAEVAIHEWHCSGDDTLIVATSDKPDADGSQLFLQSMKNRFSDDDSWGERNFCNRIQESLPMLSKFTKVVLVDDFVGTGSTVERRVNWYKKRLADSGLNVQLYVAAVAAMETAIPKLDGLGILYYCHVWLKRGIADLEDPDKRADAVATMEKLEERLEPKYKDHDLPQFGWGRSEALFCIESYNAPNNVFPVFWWPVEKPNQRRKTLLKRLI